MWIFQALLEEWKHCIILRRLFLEDVKKSDLFPYLPNKIFKKCLQCKKKKKIIKLQFNLACSETILMLNLLLSSYKIIFAGKKRVTKRFRYT